MNINDLTRILGTAVRKHAFSIKLNIIILMQEEVLQCCGIEVSQFNLGVPNNLASEQVCVLPGDSSTGGWRRVSLLPVCHTHTSEH